MPTDYNESLEENVVTCADISALYTDCDTPHIVICSDFNCQPGFRLYEVLKQLLDDNNLSVTDMSRKERKETIK
jgi:endonuclease/exonuclease/phosphatase family metal-dependent hydrolase